MIDLKSVRESKNYTQESLARAIGKTRTLITNIESGTSKPSVETAKEIARVLGINWTLFFEDERQLKWQIEVNYEFFQWRTCSAHQMISVALLSGKIEFD